MAMKETIKKILKEETSKGYTKFELYVLNWIFDKTEGKQIDEFTNGSYAYGKFLRELKDMFGLDNKMVAEIIYLYKNNYTGGRFEQRNDVKRKEAKKYRVTYYHDVNAWAEVNWEVYGTDEDDAYYITDAAVYTGDNSLVLSKEYGDEQLGDWGDVYDSNVVPIEESIKRQLNLLKEDVKHRITDKLLIIACKDIDDILNDNGYSWGDITIGWNAGEEYNNILYYIMDRYGLREDEAHYIIAFYGENHDKIINGKPLVWDEFISGDLTILTKPKKTEWVGSKEFSATQFISQKTFVDGYSEAEVNYYDWDGMLDWDDDYIETNDTWDEETKWEKR